MRTSPPPTPATDAGPAWQALTAHAAEVRDLHLAALFKAEPDRVSDLTWRLDDLYVDLSKNRLTARTVGLLLDLAQERGVAARRAAMFAGDPVNTTEGRAALHVALRNRSGRPIPVAGHDVMPGVLAELDRLDGFVAQVRDGRRAGASGRPFRHVVNIGIGGSDLGVAMACEALAPWQGPDLTPHFVSNADAAHVTGVLAHLDPAETLVLVASKTFTTQETMMNARAARAWLSAALGEDAIARHMAALSTNTGAVQSFGIQPEATFGFWDWVGGRYSLWSAVGLALMLAVGMDRFLAMLSGAHAVDEHFRTAPDDANIPLILGLLRVWNTSFLGLETHAVLPYAQALARFPAHLQQLEMESLGKCVTLDGSPVTGPTGPILWGEPGTNAQHSFFQLLHQGTRIVPCDILAPVFAQTESQERLGHHPVLLANALAQAEALMVGRDREAAEALLVGAGMSAADAAALAPHRTFPGDRPTTLILFDRVDPYTLGRLVALYEHITFVQAAVWNINPFDQFGVELGKQLARQLTNELTAPASTPRQPAAPLHDASTAALVAEVRRRRQP